MFFCFSIGARNKKKFLSVWFPDAFRTLSVDPIIARGPDSFICQALREIGMLPIEGVTKSPATGKQPELRDSRLLIYLHDYLPQKEKPVTASGKQLHLALRRVVMTVIPAILASLIILPLANGNGAVTPSPWLDDKPVASFLFTNDDVLDILATDLGLSAQQKNSFKDLGVSEAEALAQLKQESDAVVDRNDLSVDQKQGAIISINFNDRISKLVASSRIKAESLLDTDQKSRLPDWITTRMKTQQKTFADAAATAALGPMTTGASGSYRIYATQYYSNSGAESVGAGVPDKYAKFASLGWEYHAGYPAGANYSVNLGYNGRQLNGVLVKDCGPWNIDDNYWNAAGGSRPRRLFTGLATGLPESQAAYFDDYNGGLDQFGRMVSNPAGIDLSPKAGVQLGLGYLVSGWVTVTFNWENTPAPAPGIPVYGAIRIKYDQLGEAPGQPTNTEHDVPGGRAQDFSSGRITWNRTTGRTQWVLGAIMAKFDQQGGRAAWVCRHPMRPTSRANLAHG